MRNAEFVFNRKSREVLSAYGEDYEAFMRDINGYVEQLEQDRASRLEQAIEQHRKQGSATYFGDVFGYE